MKSTTSTPAIIGPDHVVPLEVSVATEDVFELIDEETEVQKLIAAGVVAERVSQKWGYHIEEIVDVAEDVENDTLEIEAWATGAKTGGGG